jgi:ribosomal protein S11
MEKIVLKQGEAKTIAITVTDANAVAVDLSSATLLLGAKKDKSDTAYAFSKLDESFNKAQAAQGIVSVDLTAMDTNQPEATYTGELRCAWAGPPIVVDKSADFFIQIKRAVTV